MYSKEFHHAQQSLSQRRQVSAQMRDGTPLDKFIDLKKNEKVSTKD